MKYSLVDIDDVIHHYKKYYCNINGGIDGYYEKTILEADIYEIVDIDIIGYFTIHDERGLTSLVVLETYQYMYETIFDFVIGVPLFEKILFTENDSLFLTNIQRHNIEYKVQAYNFEVGNKIKSNLSMNKTTNDDMEPLLNKFRDFIKYNNIFLEKIDSFFYKEDGVIISFGAIEPLRLNKKRYCISMIVDPNYRGKGYGSRTVQYLVHYLQQTGYEVNARCYVLNDVSKKTLLRSGMVISNKLFRVDDMKQKLLLTMNASKKNS